jgi:hypothetical protein
VNELFGVEAVSANDVWAVGRSGDESTGVVATLIEHYDGNTWSVADAPAMIGEQAGLYAVSAAGPDDVWAVGRYGVSQHWNGKHWRTVSYPVHTSQLNAVLDTAPGDAWAVSQEGFIGHWNGSDWTSQGAVPVTLNDISGTTSSDLWAVGSGGTDTHAYHWDGAAWTAVPVPHSGGYNYNLEGVDAITSTDVWAVGYKHRSPRHGNQAVPLLKHWNGQSWTTSRRPDGSDGLTLLAVDGSSGNDVWAVGAQLGNEAILHWNGDHWSRTL